jgi:hypothetical protein
MREDPQAAAAYAEYLELVARLTNKFGADVPDLREPDGRYFLPPSRPHGMDLVSRLYSHRVPPEGFSLIEEMVRRIRSGVLALHPSGGSGWYEWQTWALEPLLAPDKTPEAARLRMNEGYRRQFEDMFKAAMAVPRDSGARPLGLVAPAMATLSPERMTEFQRLRVRPGLTVEPMLTYYQRRADGYDFVRGVLESSFGLDGVRSMRRLTAAGPAEASLDQELLEAASLFRGAAAVSAEELGLARAEEAAARHFPVLGEGAGPGPGGRHPDHGPRLLRPRSRQDEGVGGARAGRRGPGGGFRDRRPTRASSRATCASTWSPRRIPSRIRCSPRRGSRASWTATSSGRTATSSRRGPRSSATSDLAARPAWPRMAPFGKEAGP